MAQDKETTAKKQSAEQDRTWYVVDMANQVLGRAVSRVAFVLQGKHNPSYVGNKDMGDHVIILNAKQVVLTGDKWTQRFHHHHSRHAGGIHSASAKEVAEKDPRKLIIQSVYGMLPRNHMRKLQMKRLHVYADATHPHKNVTPIAIPSSKN